MELTPQSRVLLKKLTVTQRVKKFPAFYGTDSSLPCSQKPATDFCPGPDGSSPCGWHYIMKCVIIEQCYTMTVC